MTNGRDDQPGTHGSEEPAEGAGTVILTLDAGVARDLLQALTLALGPGRGTGRRTAAGERPIPPVGEDSGGGPRG